MFCGVSKSGSPTLRSTTSTPSASSSAALLLIASVALGDTRSTRSVKLYSVICKFGGEIDCALDGGRTVVDPGDSLVLAHPRAGDPQRDGRVAVEANICQSLCGGIGDHLIVVGVAGDD